MPKQSLEEFADETERARYVENQEIARALRAVRAELVDTKAELAATEGRLKALDQLHGAPVTPPDWLTPAKPSKAHVGIPTLALADAHFDEVVDPAQVDGVNAYNRTIAERRLRAAFEGAVRLGRDYLSGVRYEGIVLAMAGDTFSGTIHEELAETNEGTPFEALLHFLAPIEAGIDMLAEAYGKVHVVGVPGNHGRRSRKPRFKSRAQDNLDWLCLKLIERDFTGRAEVTVQVPEGMDAHYSIYSTRFLLTHGDQFRGGSGISGALAPLLLGTHRKTRRQMAAGAPYDIMIMGHWHQYMSLPAKGLIVCPTSKGYDEYAYGMNLEPEPAQQAYFVTTPEHGVTFQAPIFVADRSKEGW